MYPKTQFEKVSKDASKENEKLLFFIKNWKR